MSENRSAFYEAVKVGLYRGTLPDWQKEPLDRLIDEGRARERSDQDTAYVLATAHHETARFQFMEEIGKGEGRTYGKPTRIWSTVTQVYYGRGFVQLTWPGNYGRMSAFLGIDLINNPDLAKEPETAAKVIWEGMIRGMFTGKNLADFIKPDSADYVGARQIVNGTDRDEEIAEYARQFESALELITEAGSRCPIGREDCPLHTGEAA